MITLICGRCNAGKTTYSMRFDDVIHLDLVARSGRERYPKILELVSQRTDDVVVDGVYEKTEYRTDLINAYKGNGTRCIWLDTPVEIIAERSIPRCARSHVKPHGFIAIPRHFDEPTLDEGWDEIIIIRGNENVERYSRQTEN